ncbi:MAG: hypothetical protein AB7T27_11550 [Kiritimatiellia bacterium]
MKTILTTLCVVMSIHSVHGESTNAATDSRSQWIGCKAPPIQLDSSDRSQYAEQTYKGKKVLLYSFDAGNFVDAPDMVKLLNRLESLQKVRKESKQPFSVIGYTRGIMFSPCLPEISLPEEIDSISHFPVVNLNNKRGNNNLGEPYNLLKETSGILIGTNGIICHIFTTEMDEEEFREADMISAWEGPMKEPPSQHNQNGSNHGLESGGAPKGI